MEAVPRLPMLSFELMKPGDKYEPFLSKLKDVSRCLTILSSVNKYLGSKFISNLYLLLIVKAYLSKVGIGRSGDPIQTVLKLNI